MSIFVLGIDLGKNVCSLVGLDETGAVFCYVDDLMHGLTRQMN
ncbi:hypothetical protein [Mesorhizobium sp.]|nr:hypothetical protein [Mesorhizobium sp.]